MHAVATPSTVARKSNHLFFPRKLFQPCIPTVPFDCCLLSPLFVLPWNPNSIVYLAKIYSVSLREQTAPERVIANKMRISVES